MNQMLYSLNDYLDLALLVDADGLHIGQGDLSRPSFPGRDLPLPVIRQELPVDKIVGCSVSTVSQAIKAQSEVADYIAEGSMFPTTSKKEAIVVGIDRLKEVKKAVSFSVVAVRGINQSNIGQLHFAPSE